MKSKKLLNIPVERIYLVLGLTFGIWMVFVNPPFHANDEDRHFTHAYYISEGMILPKTKGNLVGGELPVNLHKTIRSFQGVQYRSGKKIKKEYIDKAKRIGLKDNGYQFYHNFHYKFNPIPFLPFVPGIWIGKLINPNPVWLGYFARISGLIFFLIIIFFSIKITPIGKLVFFLYALTPMVLYQGSSVTYDSLSIALSFLLFAIYLRIALDKDVFLDWKKFLIICIIATIHAFAKKGYFLIPFAIFIIPPSKLKSIWMYVIAAVFFTMLYYIPDVLWKPLISQFKVKSAPKLQKDFEISIGKNLALIKAHPGDFISNMWANFNQLRKELMSGIIGRFGYSYTLFPDGFYVLHGIALLGIALLDRTNDIALKIWQKIIIFIIGFGNIFAIIVAFYLLSPVGAKMIFGLQGRYFISMIPMILMLFYTPVFYNKKWERIKIPVVTTYIVIVLIYTMTYLNGAFYSV